MQNILQYIGEQLSPYYDKREIKSLTRLILESVCGLTQSDIICCKTEGLSPNERLRIETIVLRLQKQEPIQYILEETEFYGLSFFVNNKVLIPRPETEELVDLVIRETAKRDSSLTILDIGTGSGCIAVCLAKHISRAKVYAIDISADALETARKNGIRNGVDVQWGQHNIFSELPANSLPNAFDIIISNPPYVTLLEKKVMTPNVLEYEPHLALFVPDDDPLMFYKRLADLGKEKLVQNGKIYLEISSLYGNATVETFMKRGYKRVSLLQDISGKDRIIKVENR